MTLYELEETPLSSNVYQKYVWHSEQQKVIQAEAIHRIVHPRMFHRALRYDLKFSDELALFEVNPPEYCN